MSSTHGADKAFQADADLEMLSAWLDGELEPAQQSAMLERLRNDPSLRAQFEWFNLAGDALRSHETAACHCPGLTVKVRRALASEPVRVGAGRLSGARRHLATGLTLAAAAATLVLVALPQLRTPDAVTAPPSTVAGANQAAAGRRPVVAAANPLPARTPTLDAYFRAHRELATAGVMPSAVAYIRLSSEPER